MEIPESGRHDKRNSSNLCAGRAARSTSPLVGEVGAKRREGVLRHETQCPAFLDSFSDHLLTSIAIAHHLVIPEPQYLETLRTQPRGTRRSLDLTTRLVVLAAVHLDDQASAEPYEVGDIGPDWSLPSEWDAVVAKRPQQPPHLSFRVGLIAAKAFRG